MIFAQTRSAFVARENRCTLFRIIALALTRFSKRQVDTPAAEQGMLAVGEQRDAVKEQPRRPAPHHDVAVFQPEALRPVAAPWSAPQENRGQAKRHRNNRLVEVFLVAILMQRQARAGLVAVDQAG